jgi:pimeloyl-ACP methyl ester carboxylesterase
MRRVVRRVVLTLLVLVLVVAGALTWILSGRIGSSALAVKPAEPSYDVEVVSVDGDRVVLDDSGHHQAALHRGFRYGLRWEGGSAIVGGPAEEAGDHEVSLALLDGDEPEPGTEVDAFRDLYDEPGDDPDLALRKVSYDADGHTFPAYVAGPAVEPSEQAPDRSRWAVLVHGKGGRPMELARMAKPLVDAGRTVMLIGYRNDAGAWEDPSGRYGYGTTEWRDLRNALVWARDHGARDVVLGGVSMGGGIVASYLERIPDHQGITGAILDSPMLSLDETISWGAREESLPGGLPLPEPLVWAAERVAGWRFDVSWQRTDYLDDTDWADVPILVLHGDDDGTVPLATSQELAQESSDVTLEEFPGAGHVESWNSDPERYDSLVEAFGSR